MSRAHNLLETSGLDALPAETIPALAPQMQSPPGNDLQNTRGFTEPTGKKFIDDEGWVGRDTRRGARDESYTTIIRNRADYICLLIRESVKDFLRKHPKKLLIGGAVAAGVGYLAHQHPELLHHAKEVGKGILDTKDAPAPEDDPIEKHLAKARETVKNNPGAIKVAHDFIKSKGQ